MNGGDRRSVNTDAPEVSDTSRYESMVGPRDDVKELLSTLCRVKVPLDVHNPDSRHHDRRIDLDTARLHSNGQSSPWSKSEEPWRRGTKSILLCRVDQAVQE